MMDYANSLDKIGSMAKTVEDCALMLNVIAGRDEKDSTSLDSKKEKVGSTDCGGVSVVIAPSIWLLLFLTFVFCICSTQERRLLLLEVSKSPKLSDREPSRRVLSVLFRKSLSNPFRVE
jgi:hypothetical protein